MMGIKTMSEQHPLLSVREVVVAVKLRQQKEDAEAAFDLWPDEENEKRLHQATSMYRAALKDE